MAGFYAALRRQNDAAPLADFVTALNTREEVTDLMAGGEQMAELEAEVASYMATHHGHPPEVGS